MSELKKKAAKLLRKYDETRAKLRELEKELDAACTAYGREANYLWLSPDKFRVILITEQEQRERARLDRQADEHAWEKQHG